MARNQKHASRNRYYNVMSFRPNTLNSTIIYTYCLEKDKKEVGKVINLNETIKLRIKYYYFYFSLISFNSLLAGKGFL